MSTKHIYIIVGEPRTGKTTLGKLASLSHLGSHYDTDVCNAENLLDNLQIVISEFISGASPRALLIILGRHRRRLDEVLTCARAVQNDQTHVTVCRIEKLC